MVDEIRSNLEPIEDEDLNFEKKFSGEDEKGEIKKSEVKVEALHVIESSVERKEGAAEKESTYSKILAKVGSGNHQVTSDDDVKSDAALAVTGMDAKSKITNLVQLAQAKGIPHAVKVARHMEDNYILDEFHDRLLGKELHDALVERGMIREI